jgi:4,5-DOPA dioxygenase extradiol
MPVLFVGHGSPMNVIEDTAWRFNWRDLGQELLARPECPQLIVCISAHWLTQGGWCLLGMAQPRTIHDFGGFPRVLYEQRYPAPGAPAVARTLAAQLRSPATGEPLRLDEHEWGLDHGAWGVLLPMFPAADIPVLQLSMDYSRPPAEHFALGQQLRALRDQGVLIVASGNIVHNLGYMRTGAGINATYPWAHAFDAQVTELVRQDRLAELAQFQQWGQAEQVAELSHPTYEHFLPLLYAAGAVEPGESLRFFNTGFQAASISMRSIAWGL